MGSVLIAMPKNEDSARIAASLKECGLMLDVEICANGSEVLRVANARDYGVIICTPRLRDMSYTELTNYLPKYFGMIVLTSDASLETMSNDVVKLMLPFKKRQLVSTIEIITSNFFGQIRKKNKVPPKRSEKEQKIIDDAKALLIEVNGMTEPEAFRYIQKISMDQSRSMVETSQMILLLNC